jgi:hypothetical protein
LIAVQATATVRGPVSRFAVILAFVAILLSGGGAARFTHVMLAHGGAPCLASECGGSGWELPGGLGLGCGHVHTVAQDETPTRPTRPAAPADEHSCPVCAELAFCTPAPILAPDFHESIAVLAVVHEEEAGRLLSAGAPRACAARPPPRA